MFPYADTNPTKRWEIVTYLLVAINAGAFLWLNSLTPQRQQEVVLTRGFIPACIAQLADPQKVVEVPVAVQERQVNGRVELEEQTVPIRADRDEIILSAITCMFLHGGWLHLLGNMWFLLLFGNNVEDRLGHFLYLFFYFAGGLAATATHWAIEPGSATPVIGASGAVAAVLGAYAVTFPHARVKTLIFLFIIITTVELPAYVFLVAWFGMQLLEGLGIFSMGGQGGVAWWAHIGGFVVGAVLMPLLRVFGPRDEPPEEEAAPKSIEAGRWFGR